MEVYIVLTAIIMFLLCFIVFQQIYHMKTVDRLTSKILAKDFREYSYSELEKQKEETKRKAPQVKDKRFEGIKI